jgi:hypothetical protein
LEADDAQEKQIIVENVTYTDEYSHSVTLSIENSIIGAETTIGIKYKTLIGHTFTKFTSRSTTKNEILNLFTKLKSDKYSSYHEKLVSFSAKTECKSGIL